MAEQVKKHLTRDAPSIQRVFRRFDQDGGGSISYLEFRDGVRSLGIPLQHSQIRAMWKGFTK